MPKSMCRLIFETVKWADGAPRLLPWHQERVGKAMEIRTITYSPSPTFEAIHRDRPMIAAVRGVIAAAS